MFISSIKQAPRNKLTSGRISSFELVHWEEAETRCPFLSRVTRASTQYLTCQTPLMLFCWVWDASPRPRVQSATGGIGSGEGCSWRCCWVRTGKVWTRWSGTGTGTWRSPAPWQDDRRGRTRWRSLPGHWSWRTEPAAWSSPARTLPSTGNAQEANKKRAMNVNARAFSEIKLLCEEGCYWYR